MFVVKNVAVSRGKQSTAQHSADGSACEGTAGKGEWRELRQRENAALLRHSVSIRGEFHEQGSPTATQSLIPHQVPCLALPRHVAEATTRMTHAGIATSSRSAAAVHTPCKDTGKLEQRRLAKITRSHHHLRLVYVCEESARVRVVN